MLVHGGFWRSHRTLEQCTPVAEDLARRGWTTWNVEYRRGDGCGWRETLEDCAAAVDHVAVLAEEHALAPRRVLAVGYSAGGHLAVWAAGRAAVARRSGSPAPRVALDGVVALAATLDLEHAARTHVGEDAATQFLGAFPDEDPFPYAEADTAALVPIEVPVHCLHSRDDARVPFEQSARYVQAALRAGDPASLTEIGGGHDDPIDIGQPAWHAAVEALETLETTSS